MKYTKVGNVLKFDKPLKKHKNGIKILFYREPDMERNSLDYPAAYADTENKKTEMHLPYEIIQLFEVMIKVPRYWFFPFIWYKWEVINSSK